VPLDPHAQRLLARLAALAPGASPDGSLRARRRGLEELLQLAGAKRPMAAIEERSIAGPGGTLRLRSYVPAGAPAVSPGLLYLHGGGCVAGSLESHDAIARSLAHASACRVVAVDYRLAPEHPWPAAREDVQAAWSQLAAHAASFGIEARRLGVAGDSAGAMLAAALCQRLAAAGQGQPALQLLLCPILDYAGELPSRRAYATGYLLDEAMLAHDRRQAFPGIDPSDPQVSPLRAGAVSGLAPAIIHTAECDPVRDEGGAYAARLERAGVPAIHRCHSGMIHLFYGLAGVIPQAREAFRLIGEDVRARLG
jgi:acetyl esterase